MFSILGVECEVLPYEDWEKIERVGRRHIEAKHNIHLEIDRLESIYPDFCLDIGDRYKAL